MYRPNSTALALAPWLPVEPEDEFGCLNLDVTAPKSHLSPGREQLPVVVWIHGGSQAVTFGSAASGVCDATGLVEASANWAKPVLFVTPEKKALTLRETLRGHLHALGDFDLGTAPVGVLVKAVEASKIPSWFLQADPTLEGWQSMMGAAERLIIGDVQNESIIWREGVWAMETSAIVDAFSEAGNHQEALKRHYNIHPNRPSS
ncbi:hypothetical protein CSHISOI_06084, partial [Colletotrichum shisoi]